MWQALLTCFLLPSTLGLEPLKADLDKPKPGCVLTDMTCFDENIASESPMTFPDCLKKCQAEEKCITFGYGDNNCFLFAKCVDLRAMRDYVTVAENCDRFTFRYNDTSEMRQKIFHQHQKLTFFLVSGCFEDNVEYHGADLKRIATPEVDSIWECQKLCQNTPGCFAWTMAKQDAKNDDEKRKGYCWMKTSIDVKNYSTDFISGPQHCNGKNFSLLCIIN